MNDIAGYRILEKLGEGGMGVVYKAIDTSLERQVAIKVLSSELSSNPELVQRFRAEARAQANLNHTNLATLYAFLVQDGSAAMVMEFIDGETFEQMILRRGPIPSEEAIPLFKQALLGIGYAHRAGIVHRDIKPSNLMVNRYGIVKVMDFGIAKVMGARGMTKTGTQMGTGWYMSPEQVLNKSVDIRSDIYSLGITLYQMLSANVPFQGDSDFAIMSQQVNSPPPPPTRFYPYIARSIEDAVLKALEKHPDARFQTVEEFGLALERPIDIAYAAPVQTPQPTRTMGSAGPAYQASQAPPPPPPGWSPTAASPPAGAQPFEIPVQAQAQPGLKPGTKLNVFGSPQSKIIAGGVGLLVLLLGVYMAMQSKDSGPTRLPSSTPTGQRGPTPIEQQVSGSTPPSQFGSSPAAATPPKVVAFRPHANAITTGQAVRLSWSVTGASEVNITPGVGTVKPQGTVDVPLRKTTEFTLVAKNQKGESATSTTTVTVAEAQAPPTPPVKTPRPPDPAPATPTPTPAVVTPPTQPTTPRVRPEIAFDATPNQIRPGGFTMLRWYLSNADSASIEPGLGVLRQVSGQLRVNPTETTTYTLTAASKDGTVATATATVQVLGAPAAPVTPVAPARPSFAVNVYHDHGTGAFVQGNLPSCWGQLQVIGNHLQYRVTGANDGRRDDFDMQLALVQEVGMNRMPIRNQPAFHLTINRQHFNFVPVGASAVQAVTAIQQAMQQR